MPSIKMKQSFEDMLEDSSRTIHFKRVKIALYSIDIVVCILLLLLVILYYGVQILPLFIPLDIIILVVGIIGFIVLTEDVSFRYMELVAAETSSTKLIIVRRINNRALLALLIALMVAIILVLPQTPLVIENTTSTVWFGALGPNDKVVTLTVRAKDYFDATWVKSLKIEWVSGVDVSYNLTSIDKDGNKRIIYSELLSATGITERAINLTANDGYREYQIMFLKTTNQTANVGYDAKTTVTSIYTFYIPLLAMGYVCMSAPIMAIVQIKKRKYLQDSIYENV